MAGQVSANHLADYMGGNEKAAALAVDVRPYGTIQSSYAPADLTWVSPLLEQEKQAAEKQALQVEESLAASAEMDAMLALDSAALQLKRYIAGGGTLDHAQLGAEREVGEIAIGEIGDIDPGAGRAEAVGEEPGLVGPRGRGEAVKVQDAVHFLVGAGGGGGVSSSVNLISASALNSLNGS